MINYIFSPGIYHCTAVKNLKAYNDNLQPLGITYMILRLLRLGLIAGIRYELHEVVTVYGAVSQLIQAACSLL